MDPIGIVAIVIALAVVAGLGWYLWQKRRSEQLQASYGPEYSRTVEERGNRRRAEAELIERKERVEKLEIHPLSADRRDQYTREWRTVQATFVDQPEKAVTEADGLVEEVMKARGYPVADFDQQLADLSVHHPRVVENYRSARTIALQHRRGQASTEDLRQAMVYYRELFEDLLEDREHAEERLERAGKRDGGRESKSVSRGRDSGRESDSEVRP